MSLPPEKVQELKQLIHNHMSHASVHSRIKSCVEESFTGEEQDLDEAHLLKALKDRGIVDEVMKSLRFEGLEREERRKRSPKGKKVVVEEEEEEAVRGIERIKFYDICSIIINQKIEF